MTVYKDFVKKSSADDRQLLGIVDLSLYNSSGNKCASFAPEDRFYYSNEWYALIKNDKKKVRKICSGKNEGKKVSKSVG